MQSFTYVIRDKEGVHARPAGIIVEEAKKFNSKITVVSKGRSADLKRIFAIMGLCIKFGEEITVNIEGPDEVDALEKLKTVFASNI